MNKTIRIIVGLFIGLGLLALILIFLNNYAEGRIKKSFEKNLEDVNVSYGKVDVDLLKRRAVIIAPRFEINGKNLAVDTVFINDIHLLDLITGQNIIVENIKLSNPILKIYNFQNKETARSKNKSAFENRILVKRLDVNGGNLKIFEKDSSNHRLHSMLNRLQLKNIEIDSVTLNSSTPFNYSLVELKMDSLFFDLDEQHEITLRKWEMDSNSLGLLGFKIIPKYSKTEHQKTTPVEKDRYDLSIDSIGFSNFHWGLEKDSLKFTSALTHINAVNFSIYRDKTLPDDESIKPLYSKVIRELPLKLGLDSVAVTNMYLQYEEKIDVNREAGMVEFSNMNAGISNVTNIKMQSEDFPKTVANISADFMKTAALEVLWEFDISDEKDNFHISGEMENMEAKQLNDFLKPAKNVRAKGEIISMFFNFFGDNDRGSGDMRLQFEDFKVEVLKQNGKEKKALASGFANIVIKNEALDEAANYKRISFTRDKTKSFWNYFWNLIKNGALEAFT